MMGKYLKRYWFWFYLVIVVYTLWDYIDHVTRPDANFSNDKSGWFLFNASSALALCLVIAIASRILDKISSKNWMLESLAIIIGFLTHLTITGPIFKQLFYGHSPLIFIPNWAMFVFVVGLFLVIRVTTIAVVKIIGKNTTKVSQDIPN